MIDLRPPIGARIIRETPSTMHIWLYKMSVKWEMDYFSDQIVGKKRALTDTYPVDEPRQAELRRFAKLEPNDAWKLIMTHKTREKLIREDNRLL